MESQNHVNRPAFPNERSVYYQMVFVWSILKINASDFDVCRGEEHARRTLRDSRKNHCASNDNADNPRFRGAAVSENDRIPTFRPKKSSEFCRNEPQVPTRCDYLGFTRAEFRQRLTGDRIDVSKCYTKGFLLGHFSTTRLRIQKVL